MPIETVVSMTVAVAALIFTALSFRRTSHSDTAANAMERANMTADIRYIRTSVDDIKLENKAIQKDIVGVRERLAYVEQSAKSAHSRIDALESKEG